MRAQASLAIKHSHHRAGSAGKDLFERTRGPAWMAAETLIACHQIRPAQVKGTSDGPIYLSLDNHRQGR